MIAERIEDGLLAMQQALTSGEESLRGDLQLVSADWLAVYVLPSIIAASAATYPRVGSSMAGEWRP